MSISKDQLREKLEELTIEHRDLDEALERLAEDPAHDMLKLQRMKKRKLALKDMINKIESMLIDDWIA